VEVLLEGVGVSRRQLVVGAITLLLVAAAVATALALGDRILGGGVTVIVRMRHLGAVKPGIRLRVAGDIAGEVREVRYRARRPGDPPEARPVELELFVLGRYRDALRVNSDVFVMNASVLGEPWLEIGPPRDGAPPGPRLEAGQEIDAADPPDLDKLLVRTEASLRAAIETGRYLAPDARAFARAVDQLLDDLAGPLPRGRLTKIAGQTRTAVAQAERLISTLRQAGGIERARAVIDDLSQTAAALRPELSALGERIERAITNATDLRATVRDLTGARGVELSAALASLRKTAAAGERLAADVASLWSRIERGDGTIGALLHDRELWDDFHDTHRIIKNEPLRFFLKPLKKGDQPLPSR
jgi:ABC-type transporter Mla subunit MlaD